jgi:deoxyribodipyrimidine photo-lyase
LPSRSNAAFIAFQSLEQVSQQRQQPLTDDPFFSPTRVAGLRRLATFAPHAGRAYAAKRNFDYGAGLHTSVSALSPYIRHRLITESEVVTAVLQVHSTSAAEKFIQEVCWRTYWKGWLEQRPQVWTEYLDGVATQRAALREDDATAAEIAAAERGDTGIPCFDAWVRELVETGYLHNHARMWFASIWIFTLKLPWTLGADFFLRHLLDGDPASNTLSWRWVAGLHTRGKTYLARPDNIAEYTAGRFQPGRDELAAFALPLGDNAPIERVPSRPADALSKGARVILLVTEEDLSPETWPVIDVQVCGIALFAPEHYSAQVSPLVQAFKAGALADAETRASAHWSQPVTRVATPDELIAFAANQGATSCVTTRIPVGFVRPEIENWALACRTAGVPLVQIARRWDSLFWPHATAGFFKLKERIPGTLAKLDLTPAERPS